MLTERNLSEDEVSGLIPHRRPFRFIDGATILEPGKKAKADLVDLTQSEFAYLKTHFPGGQIIPGVILIEALAELLGTAAASGGQNVDGKFGVFRRINNFVFKTAILPGDTVRLEADVIVLRHGLGIGNVKAFVGENIACQGEISFGMVDKVQFMENLQARRE